ncbi:MAG TPA: HDOD domain-containing protein, partial [Methylomirabilota bacterium]|nr:HDOD domain-containing protein [Methylomirabilota bacterium]
PKNRQLYRLVASSYFAGLFAMALGRELGDTNAEELLVVGVLSQLPRLLLAHAFPDRYAEVEAQLQTGRLTLDQACRDVFGVGYREVAGEVAQFWNLPEPVAKAVRGEPRTDALGTVLRESARLADLLFGHNATATDSMATSERRLRQALNKPDFKLNPFITRTCEEDPNVARFFRLGPGDIARMIENAGSGRSPAPAPPTPPPAGPDSARPAEAPPEPGVLIGHYLTDLMVSIRRGADINRILLTALEAIFRCVRSECVVLAFRDMSRSTLTGRFHLSSLPRFRATDFRIELSGTPSPLARALTQRQTVQLRARQEMPDSWLERTGLDGVLAVPIEVRGNAVGLCVVGRRDPALFSEQEQVWIEAVVGHVVTAFERVRPK